MKNGRFLAGLVAVAGVVAYLMWTGINDSMVYYMTPVELMERIEEDPSFRDIGVKVSGRVVEGTWQKGTFGERIHNFRVADLAAPEIAFNVRYENILPDTFNDKAEVVLEGSFDPDGTFRAHTVLTKCGSRYEATEEELAA